MSTRSHLSLSLLLVILLPLVMMGCRTVHEADLFFPRQMPRPPAEAGRDDVILHTEDGLEIGGWNVRSPAPRAQLIYFYGNGETVTDSLRRMMWLAQLGQMDVLCVDYRGYGFSDGTPRIQSLLDDALLVFDHAATNRTDPHLPMLVFGRSLGTAAAHHIAAHRPVSGMILEAPFTSRPDVLKAWNRKLPIPLRWFVRLRPEASLAGLSPQPVEAIRTFNQPLLILHGSEDTIIPVSQGKRMYDAAGSIQKTWCSIPERGHNDLSLNLPEAEAALRDFLEAQGEAREKKKQ